MGGAVLYKTATWDGPGIGANNVAGLCHTHVSTEDDLFVAGLLVLALQALVGIVRVPIACKDEVLGQAHTANPLALSRHCLPF